MHAALDRVDVVRVGEDLVGVRAGVLHRHLDVDAVALGVGRDDRVQRILLLVEPLDERDDAAVERVHALAHRLAALVAQRDREAAVEKRELAQALLQDVPVELGHLEHLGIGLEPLYRPGAVGLAELLELLHRDAALEPHLPQEAVAPDVRHRPLGERVDDGDADAVQAARHLVAALAELRACVEDGHDDLDRGKLLLGVKSIGMPRPSSSTEHDASLYRTTRTLCA